MQRLQISVEGFDLSYLECNPGRSNSIIFIHGNSSSSQTWKYQLNSPLLNQFRLIAIDLPGHGFSSVSKKPLQDYDTITIANVIRDAIAKLTQSPPILVGFSFGTNIASEVIGSSGLVSGAFLVGCCVVSDKYGPDVVFKANTQMFFESDASRESAQKHFENELHTVDKSIHQFMENDFLSVDKPFRSSLWESAIQKKYGDEISYLEGSNVPVAIVYGQSDSLVYADYLENSTINKWKGSIHQVPNAGHYVHLDQSTLINQMLADFANEVFDIKAILD